MPIVNTVSHLPFTLGFQDNWYCNSRGHSFEHSQSHGHGQGKAKQRLTSQAQTRQAQGQAKPQGQGLLKAEPEAFTELWSEGSAVAVPLKWRRCWRQGPVLVSD